MPRVGQGTLVPSALQVVAGLEEELQSTTLTITLLVGYPDQFVVFDRRCEQWVPTIQQLSINIVSTCIFICDLAMRHMEDNQYGVF